MALRGDGAGEFPGLPPRRGGRLPALFQPRGAAGHGDLAVPRRPRAGVGRNDPQRGAAVRPRAEGVRGLRPGRVRHCERLRERHFADPFGADGLRNQRRIVGRRCGQPPQREFQHPQRIPAAVARKRLPVARRGRRDAGGRRRWHRVVRRAGPDVRRSSSSRRSR